jgi:hypothetical protein
MLIAGVIGTTSSIVVIISGEFQGIRQVNVSRKKGRTSFISQKLRRRVGIIIRQRLRVGA